jgi:hypothetical protein
MIILLRYGIKGKLLSACSSKIEKESNRMNVLSWKFQRKMTRENSL